ncbi:endonuclease or glycosyl hydrolase [Artemisia annua]|uniref:Endonuclease or glycosyl hydrolase n=1 Tax=Artemisia annua TaxID=35608 RepID=A0A2U1M201_ARTAN|nr:endonuclease or glycosyl hydrolase [Artemisia annua]
MANGMTSGLMLSSGSMEQPTNFPQQSRNVSEGQIAVLWDMENCPVPSDVRPEDVAGNIRMALRVHPVIKGTVSMISAYGDFNGFPRRLREGCQRTGVNLIDVPNGRKDAADKAILVDMFLFALDNPPPAIIMLISGDVDFSRALHVLGQRGYTVILVIPSGVGVSSALSNAGSYVWDWSSVVRGVGFVPPVPPARARPMVQPDAGANEEEAIVYRGTSMESRSSSEQNSNDVMWVQPGDLNGLKGQFVKLLESSGGQIPLGRLPSDYQKSFGRPLYVSEYGTLKLVNLLKKMSDVICVEGQGQKKLVLLKKYSTQTIVKHDRKGKGVQEENTGVARGSSDEFSEDEIIVFEQRDDKSTEILNQFRYELQEILVCYSCRIFLGRFEAIYQQRYKRPLDCRKFGVNKLEELFEKVKEVVELHEEPVSRKKFLVAVGL